MPSRPPSFRPSYLGPRVESEKKRKKEYDDRRGSAHQRGYGVRWRKAAKGWLTKHPLCAECQREGVTRAASEVDHIIPHKGDMKLFWSSKNWQSLCKAHHSRKTALEDSAFARPGG